MRVNSVEYYIEDALTTSPDECKDKYISLLLLLRDTKISARLKSQRVTGLLKDKCDYYHMKVDTLWEQIENILANSPEEASHLREKEVECFKERSEQYYGERVEKA